MCDARVSVHVMCVRVYYVRVRPYVCSCAHVCVCVVWVGCMRPLQSKD